MTADVVCPRRVRGWRSPKTAPTETPVIVRTQFGRIFKARLTWGYESDEGPCWGWSVEDGDPHPDCWSDGVCWASNEDEEPSDQPVGWLPIPKAPPPTDGAVSGEGER